MKFSAAAVCFVCVLTSRHVCPDYVLQRNVPLQDLRVVRDNSQDAPMTNLVTENPFVGRNDSAGEDFSWLDDAIKDIAYNLRAHKFNEYDRRYEHNPDKAPRNYHGTFPRPPLRSLHWEVQQHCEVSFLNCAEYLKKKIKDTGLRRVDDTSIVVQEQHWNAKNDSKQIDEVEAECVKMRDKDNVVADPFQGPIERFQWRTSASYYMCWYTMNEVPDLRHIKQSCDNFAYCLDAKSGVHNHDVRANDAEAYKCAMYSFCPDPCCPGSKLLKNEDACRDSADNPCYDISPQDNRKCRFERAYNRNLHDIIMNRWNISCQCPKTGFEWSSLYGICIDVDECLIESRHNCDNATQICVNMPGSYDCGCRWGYMWSIDANECVENKALTAIKLEREEEKKENETTHAQSLVKRFYAAIASFTSHLIPKKSNAKSLNANSSSTNSTNSKSLNATNSATNLNRPFHISPLIFSLLIRRYI